MSHELSKRLSIVLPHLYPNLVNWLCKWGLLSSKWFWWKRNIPCLENRKGNKADRYRIS